MDLFKEAFNVVVSLVFYISIYNILWAVLSLVQFGVCAGCRIGYLLISNSFAWLPLYQACRLDLPLCSASGQLVIIIMLCSRDFPLLQDQYGKNKNNNLLRDNKIKHAKNNTHVATIASAVI